ncbi:DUF2470 domain-containing protein [Streptomyces sp. NPDC047971]|uniref:DUF2470 domain-containing protein n=1 Tax=Streptomyces sp. NPDC047971 TaxID=3154499 RepID=UPI0033E5E9F9
MAFAKARRNGPTDAERIRSVIAAAGSLSLTTDGNSYDLVAMHDVDGSGRLALHAPADSPLAAEAACAPRGALSALLEFTDIAPIAVRDRVRARVTLAGRLTPSPLQTSPGVLVLRLDVARASIQRGALVEHIGPEELERAAPDVLAVAEAAMLTHLEEGHRDVVDRLARLADPELPHTAARVAPLALDRHGITLRCEYAHGVADLRIAFRTPVKDVDEVGRQVEILLRRAVAAPSGKRAGREDAGS